MDLSGRCLFLAPRRSDPSTIQHYPLDAAQGLQVLQRVTVDYNQVSQLAWLDGSQPAGDAEEFGVVSSGRGDDFHRRQAALGEQFKLALICPAAFGCGNRGVRAYNNQRAPT